MNKKISIVIPTYNRVRMLKEAIESIEKQDYDNYEIIVIDDNSKEEVFSKIEKYKNIRYSKNEQNIGAGLARKKGYSMAKGEYIIFMDDDDYYLDSNFFNKCIKKLENKENLAFVSGNSLILYEDVNHYEFKPLNVRGEIQGLEYLEKFQTEYMKPNSTFTTMFKRQVIEKFKDMAILNDSSIYMNALLYGNAYILEDVIGVYRIHNSNITFNLDLDFLIDNLEEKKKIYNKLKIVLDNDKAYEWFEKQVDLTVRYYIDNTDADKEKKNKLSNWCEENNIYIKI